MPADGLSDGEPGGTRSAAPSPLERTLEGIAGGVSWIWLGLIAVIVTGVVLRFVFGIGLIQLEELQWHLYAVGFLAGIVGCVVRDRHVRVDVLRERMPLRTRLWVDFYGVLLFQLPLAILVLWSALPFVAESFATGEASPSAGGLPHRWLLKSALPVAFVGLTLATLARLRHIARQLFGEPPA